MTCWLKYVPDVKRYLKQYKLNDSQAGYILEGIEKEVGHNPELIKAVVDFEKKNLIKRLKRKGKEKAKDKVEMAYV